MRAAHALHATAIAVAIVGSQALRAQEQMPGMGQGAATSAAECAQAQARADRTIDVANRRLETARQSNSPAALRAAVDDMQAALRQLRVEIAPCANVQGAAGAADPHAGHAMPNMQQAPAAPPGTPVMRPGSTAPAPAAVAPASPAPGSAAVPHAGHVMPGAPAMPAADPRMAAPPAAPRSARPAPAPNADPHAGHVMPGAPAAPARSAPAAAAPRATTPAPAAGAAPQAGQTMPAGAHTMPGMAPSAPAMTMPANPVTDAGKLMCATKVEPKKAPNVTYRGRTYYFCSESDRAEFAKDPARYFKSPAK